MYSEGFELPRDCKTLTYFLDLAASDLNPKGVIIVDRVGNEKWLTYAALRESALKMLSYLQKEGLKKGDYIVFQIKDIQLFITVFWACMYGGIVAVPIPMAGSSSLSEDNRKLKHVSELLGYENICYEEGTDENASDVLRMYKRSVCLRNIDLHDFVPAAPREIELTDMAYIQFSSGSTNAPKGVQLTHMNLIYNVLQIQKGGELTEGKFSGSWMPLTHDMGLAGFHIAMICSNINQLLMEPLTFIRSPLLFLQKVMRHKITHIGQPNFSINWIISRIKDKDAETLDLSSLLLVINGAEPINYSSILRFQEKFSRSGLRDNVMFPVYGMAEACLAVTFPEVRSRVSALTLSKDSNIINTVVSVGKVLPGMELIIVDDGNRILGHGEIGEILIKGPNVTSGYYKNDAANSALFYNGYLHTGDLGFIEHNNLYITGRKKDMFFINGQNYYLSDIDIALEEGGIKNAVAAFHDRDHSLYIFLKGRCDTDTFHICRRQIVEVILQQYSIHVKQVIAVQSIPKTTSGKIKRHELLNGYLEQK
jgi:surfactin family lipopeptide synthetase A